MTFFGRVARLERAHVDFAIATVVARRSPVSSHIGDRALIFGDGRMEGFVGGSCSRDIVRRHALEAMRDRAPLLLQIRPDSREAVAPAELDDGRVAGTQTERVVIPMSCASEGAVDVYIEPRLAPRTLIVVGHTPVAHAVARLAVDLEYDVVRVVLASELRDMNGTAANAADTTDAARTAPILSAVDSTANDVGSGVDGDAIRERVVELKDVPALLASFDERGRAQIVAIVASQGHYDELALEALLAYRLAFTGLLASRRRAATVMGVLAQQGVPAERIATIRNPVGLDIGARRPGAVAVSILAELIARESNVVPVPGDDAAVDPVAPIEPSHASAIDPICGMDVEIDGALYGSTHAGMAYFFCGAHCRATFCANPEGALIGRGSA